MSNLRERVKQLQARTSDIEVDGLQYCVQGMSRSRRERLFSKHRKGGGKIDNYSLEGDLLCECVKDPETGEAVFDDPAEWDEVPSSTTGPLFSEVMKNNGMDRDDVGQEVKNSDTVGD